MNYTLYGGYNSSISTYVSSADLTSCIETRICSKYDILLGHSIIFLYNMWEIQNS